MEQESSCAVCGRSRSVDEPLLAWSTQRTADGREQHVCPACTRAGVRGIEARLDPEWW